MIIEMRYKKINAHCSMEVAIQAEKEWDLIKPKDDDDDDEEEVEAAAQEKIETASRNSGRDDFQIGELSRAEAADIVVAYDAK